MHHIIVKSLLILAITLAIISMATPHWITDASGEQGLFQTCTEKPKPKSCNSHTLLSWQKNCRGLAISAVVFLVLALACDFIPLSEFPSASMLGASLYALALILMIACISIYAAKYKGIPTMEKNKLGYSFYLMIGSLVACIAAGGAAFLSPRKRI